MANVCSRRVRFDIYVQNPEQYTLILWSPSGQSLLKNTIPKRCQNDLNVSCHDRNMIPKRSQNDLRWMDKDRWRLHKRAVHSALHVCMHVYTWVLCECCEFCPLMNCTHALYSCEISSLCHVQRAWIKLATDGDGNEDNDDPENSKTRPLGHQRAHPLYRACLQCHNMHAWCASSSCTHNTHAWHYDKSPCMLMANMHGY